MATELFDAQTEDGVSPPYTTSDANVTLTVWGTFGRSRLQVEMETASGSGQFVLARGLPHLPTGEITGPGAYHFEKDSACDFRLRLVGAALGDTPEIYAIAN